MSSLKATWKEKRSSPLWLAGTSWKLALSASVFRMVPVASPSVRRRVVDRDRAVHRRVERHSEPDGADP